MNAVKKWENYMGGALALYAVIKKHNTLCTQFRQTPLNFAAKDVPRK